jgi:hypothetical protein
MILSIQLERKLHSAWQRRQRPADVDAAFPGREPFLLALPQSLRNCDECHGTLYDLL